MLRVGNHLHYMTVTMAIPFLALIMILTSAFEFSSRHGSKIKERPTDDEVLSKVRLTKYVHMDNVMSL